MKFKVGGVYPPSGSGFAPIMVTRRTEKTIFVNNGGAAWAMRVRRDEHGNEWAWDSAAGQRYKDDFTYRADNQTGPENMW